MNLSVGEALIRREGIEGTMMARGKGGWSPAGARALVVLATGLLLAATLAVPPALPQSTGMVGQTRNGCTCHNASRSLSVEPVIDGLPGRYEPGEVYELNVTWEGGPDYTGGARAGFDLHASAGELMAPKGSEEVRVDPSTGDATHTLNGSRATSWNVRWRAPARGEGAVTLTLVVNAVNGDGVPGPGDQWGRLEQDAEEGGGGGIDEAPAFWTVVGVSIALAIVGVAWMATRGPRVQRP